MAKQPEEGWRDASERRIKEAQANMTTKEKVQGWAVLLFFILISPPVYIFIKYVLLR